MVLSKRKRNKRRSNKTRNPVSKYLFKFNKAKVFKDRKKESKKNPDIDNE